MIPLLLILFCSVAGAEPVNDHRGGDLVLTQYRAAGSTTHMCGGDGWNNGKRKFPDGDVVFQDCNRTEVMRIGADGVIVVHGKKIATDLEAYRALKDWLANAECKSMVQR